MVKTQILGLVVCHNVFVNYCNKHKSQTEESIHMQFRTAGIEYEKRSITRAIEHLQVALKIILEYTGERLSRAFEVSVWWSSRLFFCIKAMEYVLKLFITKEMNRNRAPNGIVRQISDYNIFGSEKDLSPGVFHPK